MLGMIACDVYHVLCSLPQHLRQKQTQSVGILLHSLAGCQMGRGAAVRPPHHSLDDLHHPFTSIAAPLPRVQLGCFEAEVEHVVELYGVVEENQMPIMIMVSQGIV